MRTILQFLKVREIGPAVLLTLKSRMLRGLGIREFHAQAAKLPRCEKFGAYSGCGRGVSKYGLFEPARQPARPERGGEPPPEKSVPQRLKRSKPKQLRT